MSLLGVRFAPHSKEEESLLLTFSCVLQSLMSTSASFVIILMGFLGVWGIFNAESPLKLVQL